MKKFISSLFILFIAVSFSYSQSMYQVREAMDLFRASKMQSGDWMKSLTENDIEGSPFLNDEFINGTMYTTSKYQYNEIPLRYNIFNDNLEFQTPDEKVLAMSTPEIVEKVEMGDYIMAYVPYSNAKKIRRGFVIILEEGKASLYAKPQIFYKKPEEPGAYKEAEPAKFIRKSDIHYIRVGKTEAKLVSTKKEMITAFPDHNEEIESFIKKNKIKPSKVEKLSELVKYYNSL